MRMNPFTLSPNPAWMYLTPGTRRNIEEIRWMIEDRQGLAAIFGDVGYGKSTLLRLMYNDYADESLYATAMMQRVDFSTPYAFTKAISAQFGIEPQRSLYAQNRVLEEFLLSQFAADKTVLLFMDETQELTADLLEVVRCLLNFETDECKLIQVIMAGQLDLLKRLQSPKNRALSSRIFSPVIVKPLTEEETAAMIRFRCERAGVPCPFSDAVVSSIYEQSGGVPRLILKTCGRIVKQFAGSELRPAHVTESVGSLASAQ